MESLPQHCVPCRAGEAALSRSTAERLAAHAPEWTLDHPRLRRRFETPDFRAALAFVNRVGMLAEEEQHHPDIHLTSWNRVELVLWTHAVGGLHPNDFVLAGKIDRLWSERS